MVCVCACARGTHTSIHVTRLQEAAAAAEAADGNLDFAHFLATSCRRRAEPAELLQEMSAGYWLPLTPQQFPQHFLLGQSSGTFKRESDIEGKMGWGHVRRRRNLNCKLLTLNCYHFCMFLSVCLCLYTHPCMYVCARVRVYRNTSSHERTHAEVY